MFDPCTKGVGYALLVVVPALYLTSAVLFTLLGVVMQCWDKTQAARAAKYDVFENESEPSITDATTSVKKNGSVLKQQS